MNSILHCARPVLACVTLSVFVRLNDMNRKQCDSVDHLFQIIGEYITIDIYLFIELYNAILCRMHPHKFFLGKVCVGRNVDFLLEINSFLYSTFVIIYSTL